MTDQEQAAKQWFLEKSAEDRAQTQQPEEVSLLVNGMAWQIKTLKNELQAVENTILRLQDPKIPRKGRSLDDWLAQVLQVLVMERDIPRKSS